MTYWLNLLLNRVSMYRLLSIVLTTMAVTAFGLAVIGLLPQSPLAMLVSAVVLVLVSYGSNVLFSRLFAVKAHNESSYITAFILFFLFSPSLQVVHLAELALIAMIASGSKYVLAVRGRHLFNPAAVATVIIALLGIAYASWWVATPILLPITLLSTLLVLYKTRRLTLAGLFLVIAISLIIVNSVINGASVASAIALLPSWPLLFFAGIMLCEPLTLPPRRWQQYLVATVVALLFAVPFHIGDFSSTPAVALVIGNAIAFTFLQRRSMLLTYKGNSILTPSSREYHFKPVRPIQFSAGQYMEITLPHAKKDGRGIRRSFSIVAAPGNEDISFGIKMYDKSSSFKSALKDLHKGAIISGTTIGGDFVLPANTETPLLFVAGGIGITPFISHLLYLKVQQERRDVVLLYSVSSITDLAYVDVIRESGIRAIVFTQTNEPLHVPSWTLVNDRYLTKAAIERLLPDVAERTAYVSGPPDMVDAAKSALKQLRVEHIVTDYFTGY